jgi:hypothetical protein
MCSILFQLLSLSPSLRMTVLHHPLTVSTVSGRAQLVACVLTRWNIIKLLPVHMI